MYIMLRFLIIVCSFLFFSSVNADDRYRTISKKEEELISRVIQSLAKADREESKINDSVLKLQGMSGTKFRHFLNNLCAFPGTRYFEIGTWLGSTLISAMYGNNGVLEDAVGCDNFCEFGASEKELWTSIHSLAPNSPARFLNQDCFSIDLKAVFPKPVTVYFYDGYHGYKEQEWAFTHFDSILDDVFIAIVDDWNLDAPRREIGRAHV